MTRGHVAQGFPDDVVGQPEAYVWAIATRDPTPIKESWDSVTATTGLTALLASSYSANAPLRMLIDAGLRDAVPTSDSASTVHRSAAFAHFGLYYRPPVAPWSRGGVVLLGDAAHATLPHAGQGANMVRAASMKGAVPGTRTATHATPRMDGSAQAIDDAWCLAEALASHRAASGPAAVAAALKQYEEKRLPKTSDIVKMSSLLGEVSNVQSATLAAVRDVVLGAAAGSGALVKGLAMEIVKQPVIAIGPRQRRSGPESGFRPLWNPSVLNRVFEFCLDTQTHYRVGNDGCLRPPRILAYCLVRRGFPIRYRPCSRHGASAGHTGGPQ